jgi:hypothetical protein
VKRKPVGPTRAVRQLLNAEFDPKRFRQSGEFVVPPQPRPPPPPPIQFPRPDWEEERLERERASSDPRASSRPSPRTRSRRSQPRALTRRAAGCEASRERRYGSRSLRRRAALVRSSALSTASSGPSSSAASGPARPRSSGHDSRKPGSRSSSTGGSLIPASSRSSATRPDCGQPAFARAATCSSHCAALSLGTSRRDRRPVCRPSPLRHAVDGLATRRPGQTMLQAVDILPGDVTNRVDRQGWWLSRQTLASLARRRAGGARLVERRANDHRPAVRVPKALAAAATSSATSSRRRPCDHRASLRSGRAGPSPSLKRSPTR